MSSEVGWARAGGWGEALAESHSSVYCNYRRDRGVLLNKAEVL